MKYSICITHYNNAKTIRASLESILSQIDQRFEVIIVDNLSNDGSQHVLKSYADSHRIVLVRTRCSRGLGRQIAFLSSTGEYVISNMDLDQIYKQSLQQLLQIYHSTCEGFVAWVYDPPIHPAGLTIAPRQLLTSIGGWRNLQYAEDWDLLARAAKINRFRWVNFTLIDSRHPHQGSTIQRLRERYIKYRDLCRLGRPVFKGERINVTQRGLLLLATITSRCHSSYRDQFFGEFQVKDKKYSVSFPSQQPFMSAESGAAQRTVTMSKSLHF